jgi:hypothetical protein
LLALPVEAQTWTFEYSEAQSADQITSCNARVDYRDGAMIVRIYGEEMDFFFFQNTLSLPPDQKLGNVALVFKADTFVTVAYSSKGGGSTTTSSMFLTPSKSDYSKILDAMKKGDQFSLYFPDGSSFGVGLSNSNGALSAVADCWINKPTGPGGRNPFSGAEGNNPFN